MGEVGHVWIGFDQLQGLFDQLAGGFGQVQGGIDLNSLDSTTCFPGLAEFGLVATQIWPGSTKIGLEPTDFTRNASFDHLFAGLDPKMQGPLLGKVLTVGRFVCFGPLLAVGGLQEVDPG